MSQFLTWLAVNLRVSASTQNQALSALLFLYKHVLAIEIAAIPPVVRARTPERLPVVLSRKEIGAILKQLTGTERLFVMLLYGTGLRLEECLVLRDLARRAEHREDLSDGLRLKFAPAGDTIALIARTIEAERHCCRFLRFSMTVEPDSGPVWLDLTGPAGTRDFVSALFEG